MRALLILLALDDLPPAEPHRRPCRCGRWLGLADPGRWCSTCRWIGAR